MGKTPENLDRHLGRRAKGAHRKEMFGHQIRSYVLAPETRVKDLRTEVETPDVRAVLDGDLDVFLRAALAQRRPMIDDPFAAVLD